MASWAAQDYESANQVPFIGPMPRSGGRILVATGYNKWGMSNAVSAAHIITADVTGEQLDWAKPMRQRITTPRDIVTALEFNLSVGLRLGTDWVRRALPFGDRGTPAEGEGFVVAGSFPPVATATVGGCTHRVDAVCPHLGGILAWNDADLSWDCPLRSSRFSADGHLLEGPATSDLRSR